MPPKSRTSGAFRLHQSNDSSPTAHGVRLAESPSAAIDAADRRKDNMKGRVLACGIFMMAVSPLGAGERLTLRVSPSVSFAPANLVVRAVIEADAANRAVE